jgi:hypothetical protein
MRDRGRSLICRLGSQSRERTAALEIGELITYGGRRYCVCGFSSATVQQAILYDPEGQKFVTLPLAEVESSREPRAAGDGTDRPALRLLDDARE